MLARTVVLIFLLVRAALAHGEVPDAMREALRAASIPEEAVGLVVIRMSDGATVLSHRADSPMPPASTLKPLTSLVAIETLGPAYRGRTQLLTGGDVTDGVLRGDLVLRGRGNVDFDWRAFDRMLTRLRLLGVREIRGDLVVDLSYFSPPRTDIGLAAFDESPEFRYNVVPDALFLNGYLIDLDIASQDGVVRMAPTPVLAGVSFVSELELVDYACPDWEDGWKLPAVSQDRRGTLQVRLKGTFPKGCIASTAINVLDRVLFVDRLFRKLWTDKGGVFRGKTREGGAPAGAKLLDEHSSRPLGELLREINKRSDNPVTRVVYLTLGANGGDAATPTARRSEGVVRDWLQRRGIDAQGLVLDNGSGLSRTERIRPIDLAAVLRAGAASRWAPEFLGSFPIVAVDGGMRSRLTQSAASRARIKTGTLRDVSAVAGYVDDAEGRPHIVVAIIHHELATRRVARPILDLLIDWVAGRTS